MPGHGINVQAAMKWLLDNVYAFHSGRPLAPPSVSASADPADFGGGTPNMKLLFSVSLYAYAALTEAPDLPIHRQRLTAILGREKDCHGQSEPTSSSHRQLWLAAVAACLFVADMVGHAELVQAATDWLAIEHAIHRVTESQGEMWCAGGRGMNVKAKTPIGASPVSGKMWQVLEGSPTVEELQKAGKALAWGKIRGKANQYDLAPWLLSRCPPALRLAIRTWPVAFPPMAGELTACRYANGDQFSVYRNMSPGVLDAALSAGVLNGERWIAEGIDEARLSQYASGDKAILRIATVAALPAGSDRPARPPRPGRKAGGR